MHILTKLFVVIAAILSVALSALTISYAANVDRISSKYRDAVVAEQSAQDTLKLAERQLDRRIGELETQLAQMSSELADRDVEIRSLQSQNVQLVGEKRSAETARASIESRIAQLGETAKTQMTLIESYREEVSALRDNELRFRNEKLDLEDRIADLESTREVLLATQRAMQEQMYALRAGEADAEAGGDGVAAGAFELPGVPVQGQILEVNTDVNGREVARIDLGSNDRIRENLKLFVYRDGTFLANMIVFETDLNSAIGTIDRVGLDYQVRPGDRVVTRLR